MSPSSLHRLCDALVLGFSAMSDALRACEAFQSIPTLCPFGKSLQLASPLQREASQPQGGNHHKAGSSSGAHRGNPAPSRNHHNSCYFRLTFCGVYYSFHSWRSLHYYYSFHVKEEILLMNLCDPCCPHSCPNQHTTVNEPLAWPSRSPLCHVLNPDKIR